MSTFSDCMSARGLKTVDVTAVVATAMAKAAAEVRTQEPRITAQPQFVPKVTSS